MTDQDKTALLSKLRAEGVQAGDGWQPIDTAPAGMRILLGPRDCPVVGVVRITWNPDSMENERSADVVHYNGTRLVAGYHCTEWAPLPAALASAPVAGEAQKPFAVLAVHKNGEIRSFCTGQAVADAPIQESERDLQRKYGYELVTVYAAPQASEAVRLDSPAQVGGVRFGKGIHWSTVIAAAQRHHAFMNTPEKEAERIARAKEFVESIQADKEGGDCAKGAGEEDERLAFEAWAATEVPAHKLGRAPWPYQDQYNWVSMDYAWSMWRKIRAALSAQSSGNSGELAPQHPRTDGGGRE